MAQKALWRKGQLAKALHRVDMKAGPGFLHQGAHLAHGKDGARLVVDQHHGDQRRVVVDQGGGLLERGRAADCGQKVQRKAAALRDGAQRLEHRGVLGVCCDELFAAPAVGKTLQRDVGGLGAAAREGDARGIGAKRRRHALAGGDQFALGLKPQRVQRGGISIADGGRPRERRHSSLGRVVAALSR